jgi:hypothetical protein
MLISCNNPVHFSLSVTSLILLPVYELDLIGLPFTSGLDRRRHWESWRATSRWILNGRHREGKSHIPHVREPTPGRRCLSRPLACALPSLVAPTGTPPPPYARCLDLHLGDLLRRRAPTRYAHPFLFLLCETEHPNPSFSVPAVRNRAPKPKLSVFGSDLIWSDPITSAVYMYYAYKLIFRYFWHPCPLLGPPDRPWW